MCGIDHSELMLRRAKRLNAEGLRRGVVDLRLAPVEDLPNFDAPFDKVLAVNAMVFWREPVSRLEELRRLLRSGGLIAVAHQPRGPGPATRPRRPRAGRWRRPWHKPAFPRCGSRPWP